ncbi:hypothetical protein XENTR_v10021148 [Xenopus tropicalis]|nr:hypothetical protein XENTR_v10021148 [Xenopus tropicalis]
MQSPHPIIDVITPLPCTKLAPPSQPKSKKNLKSQPLALKYLIYSVYKLGLSLVKWMAESLSPNSQETCCVSMLRVSDHISIPLANGKVSL